MNIVIYVTVILILIGRKLEQNTITGCIKNNGGS
jgi:hypothetical protein